VIARTVLVVDDDRQIVRALRINLTAHGYHVLVAADGKTALRTAADAHPDVIVLDLGLPDLDGTQVIDGLRGWTNVPIIVLTARHAPRAMVHALDAGADDYVTKPFGMAELLARIRAAVRRSAVWSAGSGALSDAVVETPDFTVNLVAKKVERADGANVRLTPTEWGLLEQLVRHRGKLVGQRELLRAVWGPEHDSDTNYLRVFMAQLRRKLEPVPARPRYLITEPGMGYRFEGGESTPSHPAGT
jgi:two-component system KDP operon response regulator KdpE